MPALPAVAAAALICSTPGAAFDADSIVLRVGGDLETQTELKPGGYRSGPHSVETALPAGYPPPTPPGAVELKRYPTVRRAEVAGQSNPERGTSVGFYPLFQHIQERGIAMTSPVEMDYPADESGAWTMSFLYRTTDDGPIERNRRVRVVDAESKTVVSIGLSGPYGMRTVREGLADLELWLDSQSDWVRDGDVRALYYNGPSVPERNKWAEVQVPVRRTGEAPRGLVVSTGDTTDEPQPEDSPSDLIELAVRHGAPLYNEGQPAACAAIYEVTGRSLLAMGSEHLTGACRATISGALDTAGAQHDPRERAWTLRRALDEVWQRMQERSPLARND